MLWLRQDLRLHDHPALCAAAAAAAASNAQIRIMFVFSAEEDGTGLHEGDQQQLLSLKCHIVPVRYHGIEVAHLHSHTLVSERIVLQHRQRSQQG